MNRGALEEVYVHRVILVNHMYSAVFLTNQIKYTQLHVVQSKIITSGSQLTNQLVKTQQKSSTLNCFYVDGTEVKTAYLKHFPAIDCICMATGCYLYSKLCIFTGPFFLFSPLFVNQLIDCRVTEQAGNRLFLLLTFESAVGG